MRAKRGILNLTIGLGSQIITLLLSIIIPRLIMVSQGSEMNGLIQSVTQIITYFTLLEAGVGAASLQALYKPLAVNDKSSVNRILSATSIFYKRTGVLYLVGVILLSVIYPFIVTTNIDDFTVTLVIMLTGMGNAVNYYFQGKYKILLSAEGKIYITTIVTTVINAVTNISRILLLANGFNIILVQATYFIFGLVQVLILQFYIYKNYKWIDLKVTPNFNAISQRNSVLVHQFSSLIFNNTDMIILTLFTNLKVVSVYSLYNLIFSMVDRINYTVNTSITFILGQTFHKDRKRFDSIFNLYEIYYMAFVFSILTVTLILITPFVKIYTFGVKDINYVDYWIPVLFLSIKLLINARTASNTVINIAGHFKKTQYRSLIETSINLVSSLLFVNFIGIYGVLLGTLLAVIYRTVDIVIYSNTKILFRSPFRTIKRWGLNICLFGLIIWGTTFLDINPTTYIEFIIMGGILLFVIPIIYIMVNSLFERKYASLLLRMVLKYVKKLKQRKFNS